jgi:hypothetical protein
MPDFIGYASQHCTYKNQHFAYTFADVFADSGKGHNSRVRGVQSSNGLINQFPHPGQSGVQSQLSMEVEEE